MITALQRCFGLAALCGVLVLSLNAVSLPPSSPGQESPSSRPAHSKETPKENARGKWFPLFQRHAGEYIVHVGQDAKIEARRLAEPSLRWWQPVRGGDDGALYLWVSKGKPVAVVTFFTFKWQNGTRSITHERHSLTVEPVEAIWRDRLVWKASRPGLEFRPVPNAQALAETAPARLRQMQRIARDFSANTIDGKGSTWPLRILSRPLHRYEGPVDGALFAFVQGTDPEALLLLEVCGEGKNAHWEYALARFTDLEVHVRLLDREVFSGPNTTGRADDIYYSHSEINKPSDSPDDFD
jgi:hypothetical protein